MEPTERVICESKDCGWSAIMYREDLCFDGWSLFTDCPECGLFAFEWDYEEIGNLAE